MGLNIQQRIAKIIKQFSSDGIYSDWYGMTLRQILSAMEMDCSVLYCGHLTKLELDTVFYNELA